MKRVVFFIIKDLYAIASHTLTYKRFFYYALLVCYYILCMSYQPVDMQILSSDFGIAFDGCCINSKPPIQRPHYLSAG